MSDYVKNILIGTIMIVTVMSLVRYGHDFSGESDFSGYTLSAQFSDASGLKVGDNVYLAGAYVGKVVDKSISPDAIVTVLMSIMDTAIAIPRDSSSSIQTDGLFGSKFIVIEPGGEETLLSDGGVIFYTESSIELSDLLDQIIAQGERRMREEKERATQAQFQ
ncbi:MAG: MCE family protein [Alphaproteobacteria bacterium GM202ARS2]|nr:MCE family protein [Alphaproteobacteria bacterium GM202ARS2]